ncbi:MAG: hypothetical protein CUR32_12345 [Flavobacterium sp.]|nr:MAG: hypothetical protein CUR32_12345 [Flavobacterium sp.] [Flavobacterium sp. FEMGT703F]
MFVFVSSLAQHQVINDTIVINGEKIDFKLISFGKYSKSKPLIALTCCKSDLKKVEKQIIKCYRKYKVEYTDFYIIGIKKNTNYEKKAIIIEAYLKRIDERRIQNELSTIQIPFIEYNDVSLKKVKYKYERTLLIEPNKINNLYQDVNKMQVCYLISGRK